MKFSNYHLISVPFGIRLLFRSLPPTPSFSLSLSLLPLKAHSKYEPLFSASPCFAGIYLPRPGVPSNLKAPLRNRADDKQRNTSRERRRIHHCACVSSYILCSTIILVERRLLRLRTPRDYSTNSNLGLFSLLRSLSRFAERNPSYESFI